MNVNNMNNSNYNQSSTYQGLKYDPVLITLVLLLVVLLFTAMTVRVKSNKPSQKLIQETIANGMNDEPELDDDEITDAITTEYLIRENIPSHRINITTEEGIVMLTGSIDNLLAKRRAEKVAMQIRGVRGVVNQLEVITENVSDTELQENVEKALLLNPATEEYEVTASVNNGVVTLSGEVDSWHEKQFAQQIAAGAKGAKEIINNIDFSSDPDRPDSEIKAEIEKNLSWDIRVDDGLIDVSVNNREVTLKGTVGSATEKYQAEISAWVEGVQAVDTENLVVESWAKEEDLRKDKYAFKSDAEIRQAIDDALLYDPRILSYEPVIEVENGNVLLGGTVTSLAAKRAAEEDAKNVVGVIRVKNRINVRPTSVILDKQIQQNVEDALLIESGVDRFDINVNVINGKVFLTGEVDNYFQKYQATDAVSGVQGVIAIENNISVNDAFVRDYYRDWITGEPLDINPENKLDWEIEEDIEELNRWSAFVDADEISVEVEDEIAILSGTVDTWTEYQYAEKNAFKGGAHSVDNDLTVRYGTNIQ